VLHKRATLCNSKVQKTTEILHNCQDLHSNKNRVTSLGDVEFFVRATWVVVVMGDVDRLHVVSMLSVLIHFLLK